MVILWGWASLMSEVLLYRIYQELKGFLQQESRDRAESGSGALTATGQHAENLLVSLKWRVGSYALP